MSSLPAEREPVKIRTNLEKDIKKEATRGRRRKGQERSFSRRVWWLKGQHIPVPHDDIVRTHYYGQTLCKRQCSLYLYIQTCLLRFHQSYRQKAKRAAHLSVALDPFAWFVADGARSSLHFAFCTIVIFGARCLYMIKDRFVQPRPSTRNREATKTIHQEYIITSKQRSSSVFLYPFSRPFHHYELRVHRHTTGLRRQYAFLGEHKSQRDNRASEDIIW